MKYNEDELCLAFAERVKDSPEFLTWVVGQTKFRNEKENVRLLHDEQMNIRPRKFWWRHWWCKISELNKDRETDIFMVFENRTTRQRFALHFENKKDNYRFSKGQAAAYAFRARHMANRPEYLNYAEYQTALIAPDSFRQRYRDESDCFDLHFAYEDVAKYVPEYSG